MGLRMNGKSGLNRRISNRNRRVFTGGDTPCRQKKAEGRLFFSLLLKRIISVFLRRGCVRKLDSATEGRVTKRRHSLEAGAGVPRRRMMYEKPLTYNDTTVSRCSRSVNANVTQISGYAFGLRKVFYHREFRGHREAIAVVILFPFSVLPVSSVVQIFFCFRPKAGLRPSTLQ